MSSDEKPLSDGLAPDLESACQTIDRLLLLKDVPHRDARYAIKPTPCRD